MYLRERMMLPAFGTHPGAYTPTRTFRADIQLRAGTQSRAQWGRGRDSFSTAQKTDMIHQRFPSWKS